MTGEAFRTTSGGRIDRAVEVPFTFDGKALTGRAGDTLASALLANGIHLMGRSFKYHRPRGVMSAGSEEPNALIAVDRGGGRESPNLRATQVELHAGLVARSQNCWPSLAFDIGAINALLAPLLGAGFYYKTFMAPSWGWKHIYEPLIRRAAGLGRAPKLPDPDTYTARYAHCDVLVIGSGAAGLAAALAASEAGADVILCDEQNEFGGGLLADTSSVIDGQPATAFVDSALATLQSRQTVRLLPRSTAFGSYAQNFVALSERIIDHLADPHPDLPRERLWKIRARCVVLATGAHERPLVFAGNDPPGIMLAGAAQTYLNRYGVKPGGRAVLATADDAAYQAAFDLHRAGVTIAAIADMRAQPGPAALAMAYALGIEVLSATMIAGTSGRLRVESVDLASVDRGAAAPPRRIACDLVLMSGGFTPSLHLYSQARGRPAFDAERQLFVPGDAVEAQASIGAANGTFDLPAALHEGWAAGCASARKTGANPPAERRFTVAPTLTAGAGFHGLVPGTTAKGRATAFVDFQNDVTAKDIGAAIGEGFHSIEHVKRYTTTGMATDQGKTSNMNALAIAAQQLDQPIPAIGLTTFRPPYTPVSFGTFAGHAREALFDPVRLTPLHAELVAAGAVFEDVGLWKRCHYFPRPGESMQRAVHRECLAVRQKAGLFDGSSLGKIEVVGRDAAKFLDILYTGAFSTLKPGRCRYALLLNEAGFVIDDGVIARLALDRFHVTTTTGGAARVFHHMEDYIQTEFPDLEVWITSMSEHWAVLTLQGPLSRAILAPLVTGIDFDAFAHMSVAEGMMAGLPIRLFRVSFTGEMGFEINVAAGDAPQIWDALMRAGAPQGLTPYGTEAVHILRAEKGYIILGQETDGTITPGDLGLDWAIARKKGDFIGKRSLARPDIIARDRKQLVGLLSDDAAIVLEEGAQIVASAHAPPGTRALGHVSSSYASPILGRSIALALVANGRARMGEGVFIPMPGGVIRAQITAPLFYDPDGGRLHG